ncbi:MAG TPA: PE domain-containing protein [Actinophytocola sp.]|uniref:PE domain-containing protein n=1 Tax=Actinophytocola sp. TaxID=1872138 RepID=UPI002DDCBAE9|nr:PE domain-containing protein [Actinophytocola sp.]HEV2783634.1 PE domain-containing protein [Actinophytocola sp.]
MELLGDIGRGVQEAFAQVDTYNTTMAKTSGTFTVTKDNVLAAAQIISTQADALDDKLRAAFGDLEVAPPGDDDVSTRIAPAWNDLLIYNEDSYANRIKAYIDGLRNLARQCADSAKAYGYTDEAIAVAFGAERE